MSPRRHCADAQRHLARSRKFRLRADDLDRHAGLAADRISRLRLGRSELFRCHAQQCEIATGDPQRRPFDTDVRQWRNEAGVRFNQRGWGHQATPMFHYRGIEIRETLDRLRKETGDPFEGIKMQFVNPVTGGPVFPTLDYSAQLLRPGEELELKRETCSTFVVVMEGKGFSEIGGQRFDWEKNDIMAVPNFLWRRHVNTGNSDAVLYTVSDAALLRAIGQYRSQGKHTDGKVVQIVQ